MNVQYMKCTTCPGRIVDKYIEQVVAGAVAVAYHVIIMEPARQRNKKYERLHDRV